MEAREVLCGALLGVMLATGCVEDAPTQGGEAQQEGLDPTGFEGSIPLNLKTCDLRAEGARCWSNGVCGVCDMGGVEAWYWRAGELCVWGLEVARLVPDDQARAECDQVGGELVYDVTTN